ncbi:MAG: hypothetical protein M3O36_21885 [Myxococcota bacterium]|nr:hypothetical protein [Myxococcota bacterium]
MQRATWRSRAKAATISFKGAFATESMRIHRRAFSHLGFTASMPLLASCGLDPSGLFTQADTAAERFDSSSEPNEAAGTLGADETSVETGVWLDAPEATREEEPESGSGAGSSTGSRSSSGSASGSGSISGLGSAGTLPDAAPDDATTVQSCAASHCPPAILYMTSDATMPMGRQISFRVKVRNGSPSGTLDLAHLTMRYWFASKGSKNFAFHCDYAALDCANLAGQFVAMTAPTPNADTYCELSFKSGNVPAMTDSGEMLLRLADVSYAVVLDETRDWSFDATKTAYAAWDHITIYDAGVLVWGLEPR